MSDTAATSAPRTARERARAELTREILDTARAHLEAEGAAGLSLRAVARDLGMVSSAVYRYFPSRDDLLTRLIIDAYNGLGDAVDAREASLARGDLLGRWMAVANGCRDWALAHPQEWALIYGSPVPGYEAPEFTIEPATRVTMVLANIITDAWRESPVEGPAREASLGAMLELSGMEEVMPGVPDVVRARGLMVWTQIFGFVSFELFGHYRGSVRNANKFFDFVVDEIAETVLPRSRD